MLRFTIKMMLTDIQAVFKGFWAIVYSGMIFCLISLFFLTDNPFSFLYITMIVMNFLTPQLPKLFYVLPFDDKMIRRYLHLRGILASFLLLIMGGCITLVHLYRPVPYPEQGWRFLIMMIHLCLLMSIIHVKAPNGRTKFLLVLIFLLFVTSVAFAILVKSFVLFLKLSGLNIIIIDLIITRVLKTVQLRNYVEPVYSLFSFNKKTRHNAQEGGPKA